ncbi:hypothetical protein Pmani_036228 [Petrolisthes manimaculis]|uniref:Uncharacterized protein n=1 Tax=Petrolisthes manimaculis TaxID=1843537 RepID=A0AAE1NIV5_9EUCA|nr:hypothetical protein Pmani_036228 [Petrolisthes manimaculis]
MHSTWFRQGDMQQIVLCRVLFVLDSEDSRSEKWSCGHSGGEERDGEPGQRTGHTTAGSQARLMALDWTPAGWHSR